MDELQSLLRDLSLALVSSHNISPTSSENDQVETNKNVVEKNYFDITEYCPLRLNISFKIAI